MWNEYSVYEARVELDRIKETQQLMSKTRKRSRRSEKSETYVHGYEYTRRRYFLLNATASKQANDVGKYTNRELFLRSLRHRAHTDCFFSLLVCVCVYFFSSFFCLLLLLMCCCVYNLESMCSYLSKYESMCVCAYALVYSIGTRFAH